MTLPTFKKPRGKEPFDICPLSWLIISKTEGIVHPCVQDACAWFVGDSCAIAVLALQRIIQPPKR